MSDALETSFVVTFLWEKIRGGDCRSGNIIMASAGRLLDLGPLNLVLCFRSVGMTVIVIRIERCGVQFV